ncbi:phosphoenolpyruvate carboxykinase (ATP) [Gehongia tenuis]|uniref:Phosphoenolpyruvate carboxykinase (ATP) n=1 Tax=Gehongia tenuis TaxID=2763655 RepID=A0A926D2E8_9FIRM|nr:phosphoenolpyruvate carboxykinase (ATP) [Gehongia tenuis]MBC8530251.1 phosphoenolpyruvate carboxykinase (ATP) [Gehongia tenuis]
MTTYGLEKLGIINPSAVYRNLSVPALVEKALARGEGVLLDNGALRVNTGKYTGRSPNDRFIVDEPSCHNDVDWGKVNMPISEEKFDKIYGRMCAYFQNREIYIFDGFAGADPEYRLSVRVINEMASQNMFMHQLLIRPTEAEVEAFEPGFTLVAAPGFKCIPEEDGVNSEAAIIVNFAKKMVIIAGSQFSGEMKKSVFSVLNYILPHKDVLPMHCSANMGKDGDTALFFGLSGTGKTTLSADPDRMLIGDDEHGWTDNGIFNFEGGCFAKLIDLSKEKEPQIWDAVKFGTLVENVVYDEDTRVSDYKDGSITENTRAGYPIEYIPNAAIPGVGGQPKTIVFLTADAFGVMPPIAKLTKEQAMYHFVSGYTSKLAGTERGIVEPEPSFSTCFGAPFMPMDPSVYADLLGKKMDKYDVNVYLINTGWSGGPYGVGKRMSLPYTRAMVTAALNGELEKSKFNLDPIFNVLVPETCPNVPSEILNPVNTWSDKAAYEKSAKDLAKRFMENFKKYVNMPKEVVEAGPKA